MTSNRATTYEVLNEECVYMLAVIILFACLFVRLLAFAFCYFGIKSLDYVDLFCELELYGFDPFPYICVFSSTALMLVMTLFLVSLHVQTCLHIVLLFSALIERSAVYKKAKLKRQ